MSDRDKRTLTLSLAEVVDRYQEMRAIDIVLARHGLTVFLAALLASFAERPEATIGAVARQFRFQTSVATGGLDRLEARGLIRRVGRPTIAGIGAPSGSR